MSWKVDAGSNRLTLTYQWDNVSGSDNRAAPEWKIRYHAHGDTLLRSNDPRLEDRSPMKGLKP